MPKRGTSFPPYVKQLVRSVIDWRG